MSVELGVHLGERYSMDELLACAEYCDDRRFDSVWLGEGRLARDGVGPAAVVANRTRNIRVGTGVLNNRSRNAALMAVTFKTLDELAPGRVVLGIGAWWEPLASKVGVPLERPVDFMREYVEVLRAFFRNDLVNFDGEFVHMDGVRFDSMYRPNKAVPVPIYFGAVGPRMLELAGEIADGVYLDFLLPVEYLKSALAAIEQGVAKRTDGQGAIDLTQIVSCSVDNADPGQALAACKEFLTLYLCQQPHISEHSGVDPDLVTRLKQVASWPASPQQIKDAMKLVPSALVRSVSACGTSAEAFDRLLEYRDAGLRLPVISALGDKQQTVEELGRLAAQDRGKD
jgi:5,10-methylenetetrahydromethanopterin reductase